MRGKTVLVSILIAALMPVAGVADVLVMKNGQKMETDGPWKVKGRQVIFTTPEGRLSAVRLSEVDLEASELATNPPPPPPRRVAPPPPKFPRRRGPAPKPVMVLTNDSVGASNSNTFLGAFTLTVNDTIRELQNGLGIDPEANPEAQSQIDAFVADMDRVLSVIEDTCSKYSLLAEPVRNESDLPAFRNELNQCADDLRSEVPKMKSELSKKVLTEAIPKMRQAAAGIEAGADGDSTADGSGDDSSEDEDSQGEDFEDEDFEDEDEGEDEEPS